MTTATELKGLALAVEKAGSISALARLVGVAHQVMNRWVQKGFVPLDRAVQINQEYGIPTRELVNPKLVDALFGPNA